MENERKPLLSDEQIKKLIERWAASETRLSSKGTPLPPDPPYPSFLVRSFYETEISRLLAEREKGKRYFIGNDRSSHRFLVDADFISEWDKWNELDEEDEASWEAPGFATRIDGAAVTFSDPYVSGLPFTPPVPSPSNNQS